MSDPDAGDCIPNPKDVKHCACWWEENKPCCYCGHQPMTDQPERCEAWEFAAESGWLAEFVTGDDQGELFFHGRKAPGATITHCPWCGAALPDQNHQ